MWIKSLVLLTNLSHSCLPLAAFSKPIRHHCPVCTWGPCVWDENNVMVTSAFPQSLLCHSHPNISMCEAHSGSPMQILFIWGTIQTSQYLVIACVLTYRQWITSYQSWCLRARSCFEFAKSVCGVLMRAWIHSDVFIAHVNLGSSRKHTKTIRSHKHAMAKSQSSTARLKQKLLFRSPTKRKQTPSKSPLHKSSPTPHLSGTGIYFLALSSSNILQPVIILEQIQHHSYGFCTRACTSFVTKHSL